MNTVSLKSLVTPIEQKAGGNNFPVLSITAGIGFVSQKEKFGKNIAGAQYSKYIVIKQGDFSYNKGNSKTYPHGCIYCLENYDSAAVPNVFYSFRFTSEYAFPQYYKYIFESSFLNQQLRKLVNSGVRDDGLLNLYEKDFYSCHVPCPPLEEQRRIAEILWCCDRVIALKKELIAEKKKQKKALMQKLLNPDSGFRLPGFSGEWKKTTIGESGTFVKGKGIQNSQCTSMGFPCVKYGDIYMKYNVSFNVAQSFTSESVFSESLQITSGALLFTCSGEDPLEIGKCVLYSGSDCIAVGGDIIVMYPNASISPDFLVHQQYSDDLIKQKSTLGKGNSIVHIHLPEIKSLKISLPPTIEEQKAIADILSAADKEIDLLEQELVQQEQKKKSLMQLLLTGIVRV